MSVAIPAPDKSAAKVVDSETEKVGELAQIVHIRKHVMRADVVEASGGHDVAPGPHDLFDAALATCKALTVAVYARSRDIPLERVETHVERDDEKERQGIYVLRVRLDFHGPLTEEQRVKLHDIASRCPIHKLMTTTEIQIETAPLD